MTNTARCVVVALLACACLASSAQPARDPFATADEAAGSVRGYAVDDYTVHGILMMENGSRGGPKNTAQDTTQDTALAALRTPAGDFRVVRAGDFVGREGAEVARITAAGVYVRTASGEHRLPDVF